MAKALLWCTRQGHHKDGISLVLKFSEAGSYWSKNAVRPVITFRANIALVNNNISALSVSVSGNPSD